MSYQKDAATHVNTSLAREKDTVRGFNHSVLYEKDEGMYFKYLAAHTKEAARLCIGAVWYVDDTVRAYRGSVMPFLRDRKKE